MNQPVRVGQRVTLKIDELAYSPDGIGRFENFIVFVPYSAPGDELEVLITEVRKNFSRGKIEKILKPSPDRIETPCPVFGECGGCHWQHLNYQKQLEYKEKIVRNALRAFEDVKIEKTIPADEHYYYRNKSQFPVDVNGKKTGLYALKSHYVVDVETCPLILRELNEIYSFIRKYLIANAFPITNLRHIVVRGSETKKASSVVLVLRDGSLDEATKLANLLREEFKAISVLFNINNTDTNIIMGMQTIMMFGDGTLVEEWPDIKYSVSPTSFFQTNTSQMRKMYDLVSSLVSEDLTAEACDLYCGAGTISLLIAKKFRKVIGIDEVKPAIADAKLNAELNKIENCEFLNGRVEDITANSLKTGYKPKVVILDPPRKGCEKSVLLNIGKLGAEEVVYVSCDVMTLARDLLELKAAGYKPIFIQPLDMFPNTFHVEVIVKLIRDESFIAPEPAPKVEVEVSTVAIHESAPRSLPRETKIAPVRSRESKPRPLAAAAKTEQVREKTAFVKQERQHDSAPAEARPVKKHLRPERDKGRNRKKFSPVRKSEGYRKQEHVPFQGTTQRQRKYLSSADTTGAAVVVAARPEKKAYRPDRGSPASRERTPYGGRSKGYKGKSKAGDRKGKKFGGPSKSRYKGGSSGPSKGRRDGRR